MKLLHLTFHFEYADAIERIFDRHEVRDATRYPMVEGRDRDGKHYGSQVYPGNFTVVHAQLPEEKIDAMFEELRAFRDEKRAHHHLEALILPVERRL